jgi:hypothetical protein
MQHLRDNTWEVELPKMATECSFCEQEDTPKFVLTPKVIATVRKLCSDVKVEWQMLLIGEETKNGIFCYDYYIPKQEVGAASVINKDDITLERWVEMKGICGIHSHGSMAVMWSTTDDECSNHSFIKHSIVTNNKGDYLAKKRIELPCGLVKFQTAKVIMKTPEIKKVKGFANIEERTYEPIAYSGCGYGSYGGYGGGYIDGVDWKRGDKRHHGFMYDQSKHKGGAIDY